MAIISRNPFGDFGEEAPTREQCEAGDGPSWYAPLCAKKGYAWKQSSGPVAVKGRQRTPEEIAAYRQEQGMDAADADVPVAQGTGSGGGLLKALGILAGIGAIGYAASKKMKKR